MSESKNIIFRNSVGGYNKKDVNEYIIRSSAELIEREQAASERVKRAEKELSEILEKLQKIEDELEKSKIIIGEKEEEIKKITAEKQLIEEKALLQLETASKLDFEKQEVIISKQYEEIESLKAKIEEQKEQRGEVDITKEKYEELVKKAALYEKNSASISETLISANKTAEEIVLAAREEARIIVEKAEKELETNRKNIEETSKRSLESLFGKLSLAAAESRRDVTAVTSYTYRVLEKALEDIKIKSSNSETKIKSYEESIWRAVKDDLKSISCSLGRSEQKKLSSATEKHMKK